MPCCRDRWIDIWCQPGQDVGVTAYEGAINALKSSPYLQTAARKPHCSCIYLLQPRLSCCSFALTLVSMIVCKTLCAALNMTRENNLTVVHKAKSVARHTLACQPAHLTDYMLQFGHCCTTAP